MRKGIFSIVLIVSSLYNIQAQSNSNDEEAVWHKLKDEFWRVFKNNWVDITYSDNPDLSLSIYYAHTDDKEMLYMIENNSEQNIHSIELTDFVHRLEVDVRDHNDNKTVFIYHIAEKDLEEKRRLEFDFYFIRRFGFNKKAVEYNNDENYIETEQQILTWNEDHTELKVITRNTTNYIHLILNKDKPMPELLLSKYSDHEFTFPVEQENETEEKEFRKSSGTEFGIADNALYGKKNLNGETINLGSYGQCDSPYGNFWWAKKSEKGYEVQIFDLEKSTFKPQKTLNLNP